MSDASGPGADQTSGATKGQPGDAPPFVVDPPRGGPPTLQSGVQPADPTDAEQVRMVREAEEKIMSDQRNGMDAGVPEDGAFDGDASSESVTAGVAAGGTDALPDDASRPPIDGGVMGAVPDDNDRVTQGDELGISETRDRDGELPPEEMGR